MPALRETPWALLVGLGLAAAPAAATPPAPPDLPGTGCLRAEIDGRIVDFPLKHTKVHADVSGPVARVRVTQTFANPSEETIEAVYVFPLPVGSAVNEFEMRIGDRTIAGVIERRAEARRRYEDARDSGHVAALLEQERTNVFTQSVANILPGNEIDVTLTYVETLPYDAGSWEMVFPTVVGPRFNPPGTRGDAVPAGGDRHFAPSPRPGDPDPARLGNPPFLPPHVQSGHDLEITVDWDAGIPVEDWTSPTHRVDVRREGPRRAVVTLHPLDTRPNKDFVLKAKAKGAGADTGVLAYHDGRDGYVSVLVHPKLDLRAADLTPKEMIFVLDCSGSMSGEPMAAAKGLVRRALTNVNRGDSFQIIRFSERASGLARAPLEATPENVKRGLAYLEQLQGSGGTMMIEGIKAALDFPHDPRRLRIVMFLTDGYIGNEAEILDAVRAAIGNARLFSFGVGSSVNRELLDGLALEGRGEAQYFLGGSSMAGSVDRFYERIRNPYLTDVELVWHGVDVTDRYPQQLPDVFGGQPLAVHARYEGRGDGWLEVRGRIAGKPWKTRVELDLPRGESGNPAVGTLWARARIADLQRSDRSQSDPAVRAEIESIGLSHHLVTPYTSFVAVEEKLVVSDGRPRRVRVPVEMPEGVSFDGVFGETGSFEGRRAMGMAPSPASPMPRARTDERREAFRSGLGSVRDEAASPVESDASGMDRKLAALDDKDPAGGVTLEVVADRTELRAGGTLTLTVTVTNGTDADVRIAKNPRLGDGQFRLRVLDARWHETVLGSAGMLEKLRGRAEERLAAGRSRTFTIRLTPQEAAFLGKPGVYHLFVEGAPFGGAADSSRLTVRVR
jgi:Ca-activated chloride channel homolog